MRRNVLYYPKRRSVRSFLRHRNWCVNFLLPKIKKCKWKKKKRKKEYKRRGKYSCTWKNTFLLIFLPVTAQISHSHPPPPFPWGKQCLVNYSWQWELRVGPLYQNKPDVQMGNASNIPVKVKNTWKHASGDVTEHSKFDGIVDNLKKFRQPIFANIVNWFTAGISHSLMMGIELQCILCFFFVFFFSFAFF
jgi:hypothetical protein